MANGKDFNRWINQCEGKKELKVHKETFEATIWFNIGAQKTLKNEWSVSEQSNQNESEKMNANVNGIIKIIELFILSILVLMNFCRCQ